MPLDISRDDWRIVPSDVLATESNQDAAQAWGDEQRKQIAQKWADAINRGIRTPGFADPNAIQSSGYNQPRAGGFVGAGAVLSSPYAQPSSQSEPPPGSAAPDTAPPALTLSGQPDSGASPVGAPQSDSLPAPSDQSGPGTPPVTTAALSGGVPKTVSQEGGAFYGLGDREMSIARQAGDEARRRGFGDEGAKALQAILLTEGGLTGARGDQGSSAGPLQFYGNAQHAGMLTEFAQQNKMSLKDASDYVEQNPMEAIKWALGDQDKPGYLGAALKYGISKGLTGAELATYAQHYGQRSVSPERAGQWHNTIFGSGQDPFAAPITGGAAGATARGYVAPPATGAGVANQKEDRGQQPYQNQFELGLSRGDAFAACGPAAAIAFAKANGRNPTTDEAMQLAKSVGWSQNQGMAGVASEQGLLNKMGVATTLERDVDWNHVARDATNGNPVIVSTPGHYFYVDDVRQGYGGNNQFHVGVSGTALKGGSEWMTADEIQQRMGKTNGALYADHPLAEGDSIAESQPSAQPPVSQPGVSYDRKEALPVAQPSEPGSQSGFQPPIPSAPANIFDAIGQKKDQLIQAVQNVAGARSQQIVSAAQSDNPGEALYGPREDLSKPLAPQTQYDPYGELSRSIPEVAAGVQSGDWGRALVGVLGSLQAVGSVLPGEGALGAAKTQEARQLVQDARQALTSGDVPKGQAPQVQQLADQVDAQLSKSATSPTTTPAPVAADAAERAAPSAAATQATSVAGPAEVLRQAQAEVDALTARYPQMTQGSLAASGAGKRLAAAKAAMKQAAPEATGQVPAQLMDDASRAMQLHEAAPEGNLENLAAIDKQQTVAEKAAPEAPTQPRPIAEIQADISKVQRRLGYLNSQASGDASRGGVMAGPETQVKARAQRSAALQKYGALQDEMDAARAGKPYAPAAEPMAPATTGQPAATPEVVPSAPSQGRAANATAAVQPSSPAIQPPRLPGILNRLDTNPKDTSASNDLLNVAKGWIQEQAQVAQSVPKEVADWSRQQAQANPAFAAQLGGTVGGGVAGNIATPEGASPEDRVKYIGAGALTGLGLTAAFTGGANPRGALTGRSFDPSAITQGIQHIHSFFSNPTFQFPAGSGMARDFEGIAIDGLHDLVSQSATPDRIARYFSNIDNTFKWAIEKAPDRTQLGGLAGPARDAYDFAEQALFAERAGSMAGGLSTLNHVAVNAIVQPLMRAPTQIAQSLISGNPERIPAALMGVMKGLPAAAEDFLQTIRYNASTRMALTGEPFTRQAFSIQREGAGAGAYEMLTGPLMRTHAAFHNAMQQIGRYTSLEQDAWQAARDAGHAPFTPQFNRYVTGQLATPSTAMIENAVKNGAEYAGRGPDFGTLGQMINKIGSDVPVVKGVLLPFFRIAYSLGSQGLERSPLGLAGTAVDVGRTAFGAGRANFNAQRQLTNNIYGTGIAWWAFEKAQQGLITGENPGNGPDGKPLPKNSINMNGAWVPTRVLLPVSESLGQAAALSEAMRSSPNADVSTLAVQTAKNYITRMGDTEWLRSMADVANAFKAVAGATGVMPKNLGEEAQGASAIASYGKSVVPNYNLMKQTSELKDQPRVSPSTGNLPLDVGNKIAAGIPGLRQNYQQVTDYQASPQTQRSQAFQGRQSEYQQALDKNLAQLRATASYKAATPRVQMQIEQRTTDALARAYHMPFAPVGAGH